MAPVVGVTRSDPPSEVLKSNGMMPVEYQVLDVELAEYVPLVAPLTASKGPRIRTVLASIGSELAAIIGITDTVFAVRLTTLDAARLKSRLRRVVLLAATLIWLAGSSSSVSVT